MKKIKLFLSVLFFLFAVTSCASTSFTSRDFIPQEIQWNSVNNNNTVQYYSFRNSRIKLSYNLVKISLANRNCRFYCYPDSPYLFDSQGYFKAKHAEKLAEETNCTVAVNFTPFITRFFNRRKNAGILKAGGTELSAPVTRYSSLCFLCDEENKILKADICINQGSSGENNYNYEFGGFFTIIMDGKPYGKYKEIRDGRIAAGIADNGNTLYLLEADKNFTGSTGLSFSECTEILLSLGCEKAIEGDGGNSTELVLNGKKISSIPFVKKQGVLLGFGVLH